MSGRVHFASYQIDCSVTLFQQSSSVGRQSTAKLHESSFSSAFGSQTLVERLQVKDREAFDPIPAQLLRKVSSLITLIRSHSHSYTVEHVIICLTNNHPPLATRGIVFCIGVCPPPLIYPRPPSYEKQSLAQMYIVSQWLQYLFYL